MLLIVIFFLYLFFRIFLKIICRKKCLFMDYFNIKKKKIILRVIKKKLNIERKLYF